MLTPRVFTIPVGTPVLPTLADAILDGTLTGERRDLFGLADATVYLPTRRAARALAAVLAERAGDRVLVLPRIVPLGGLGEDEAGDEETGGAASPLARRMVLARLVQLWSAKTAERDAAGQPVGRADGPGQAVALAGDLEALMDTLETEGVPWAELSESVDAEFSHHFARTLEFLRIAHESWPAILAELGAQDPARHRHAAILDQARRLAAEPPRGPVIAAGSTGSVPATAQLLAAIARSPGGAVVLPGLDTDLDPDAWRAIGSPGREDGRDPLWGHPQFMLKRLLATIGIERADVRPLGPATAPGSGRARFVSELMRPADTTEAWSSMLELERSALAREGTAGLAVVEAPDERAEALAIAVALRETIAIPGRTAALVTPDRALARRVATELGRWNVAVADSAPLPLGDTSAGRLARLAGEAAASGFGALATLALLAHPDVTLGLSREAVVRGAAALEIGALRGPIPRPGLDGIAAALALRREQRSYRDPLPRQNLSELDWQAARDVVARLAAAFAGFAPSDSLARNAQPPHPENVRGETRRSSLPLAGRAESKRSFEPGWGAIRARPAGQADAERPPSVPPLRSGHLPHEGEGKRKPVQHEQRGASGSSEEGGLVDLTRLAAPHAEVLRRLVDVAEPGPAGPPPRDRTTILDLLAEVAALPAAASVAGRFEDYPGFFAALARMRSLAPDATGTHRRIRILGLLEARLLGSDRVVLGGLDEGIWPPAPASDAFLNRPMRTALGLSPPERRIGQTAHDFAEALGTPDVIVTRARKRDGKPTVPSRFLERMRSLVGAEAWAGVLGPGRQYLAWAEALDATGRAAVPLPRPAPQPGAARFPRRLSVTEVETLIRDPYAIYARHILRLTPLDSIGTPATLAERGTIVHAILADFAKAHPGELPATAEADLLQRGLDAFGPLKATFPELYALWWPDFARIAPRFLDWEAERRARYPVRLVETRGELSVPFGHETLTLRGTADRIETGADESAAIVDFKTGTVPSDREVLVGFAPQLTLEAAMLMEAGFKEVPGPRDCPELVYVKLGGRAGLVPRRIDPGKGRSMAATVEAHVAGLARLAQRYGVEGEGYRSRPFAKYASRGLAYDHLARVREWSASGGVEGEPL